MESQVDILNELDVLLEEIVRIMIKSNIRYV